MLKKHKIFTYCLIGALAFSCQTKVTKAEESPVAGINLELNNQIQNSGNESAIKDDFLITGDKEQQLAKKTETRIAKVMATALKVRKKASINASILTLVPFGDELIVKKESKDWIEVSLEGNMTGFISAKYVKLSTDSLAADGEAISSEKNSIASKVKELQSNKLKTVNSSDKISSNATNIETIRDKIVKYALRFKGNPYVWGGTSLTKGTDCSGFTQSVFRDNGISIPRTSRTQAFEGKRISIGQMQPGDLIFYDRRGSINHVGIYIGNREVISASSPSTGIRITNYNYRQPYRVVTYIS